jgi:hypothetical protein
LAERSSVPGGSFRACRRAAPRGGGVRRLLDGDQTQAESGLAPGFRRGRRLARPIQACLGAGWDRLTDQAAFGMAVHGGEQIRRLPASLGSTAMHEAPTVASQSTPPSKRYFNPSYGFMLVK